MRFDTFRVFSDFDSLTLATESFSCEQCHNLPTGGSGSFVAEVATTIHARSHIEAVQLNNQLDLKEDELLI